MKVRFAASLLAFSTTAIAFSFAQTPPEVAEYKDINGRRCSPGAGVTVCPTPKLIGDIEEYAKINTAARLGTEMRIGFCISEKGVPINVELLQSSGKTRIDARMLKHFQTWRYNPGTVDGKPTLICGMQAIHQFKDPPR